MRQPVFYLRHKGTNFAVVGEATQNIVLDILTEVFVAHGTILQNGSSE